METVKTKMTQVAENNKNMIENTVYVRISLPEDIHTRAKLITVVGRKDDGSKYRLDEVIIKCIQLGLESMQAIGQGS